MIKNIIFDIGNVLLDFNPKAYVKSKVSEEKVEEIYKRYFKVMNGQCLIEEQL